jgi:hypothetical protein
MSQEEFLCCDNDENIAMNELSIIIPEKELKSHKVESDEKICKMNFLIIYMALKE